MSQFIPSMASFDLWKSKDSNIELVTFKLPGMMPEDVTIDLDQNRSTVSGEFAISNSREEGSYAVRERRYGKFSRTLQVPFGTKPKNVMAKMENGLLTQANEQQLQRIATQ